MGEWGGGAHPGSPLFRPAADRTGWRGCCRPTHRGRCRWGRGKRGAVWARGAGRARGPTTRRPSPSRRRPGERREGGGRHGRMRTVNNGHAHGSAATPTHLDAQAVGACDDNAGRRFRDDDRTAHRRGRDRGGARDAGQGELELSVGEEVALRGGGGGTTAALGTDFENVAPARAIVAPPPYRRIRRPHTHFVAPRRVAVDGCAGFQKELRGAD